MNGEKKFKSLEKRCQSLVTVTVTGQKLKIYCTVFLMFLKRDERP
jgi:hypothetical protein